MSIYDATKHVLRADVDKLSRNRKQVNQGAEIVKKNIVDLIIKYGSTRALWTYEATNGGTPLRVKRLDQLEAAYFDRILNATRSIRDKEV